MYKVIYISSGITAYSSLERGNCKQWIEDNNFDPNTHECLWLYTLINDKAKDYNNV